MRKNGYHRFRLVRLLNLHSINSQLGSSALTRHVCAPWQCALLRTSLETVLSYLSINLGLVNEYIYTHPVRYLILVDEVEVHEHSYHDLEGLIVGKLQVVELVAAGRNNNEYNAFRLYGSRVIWFFRLFG